MLRLFVGGSLNAVKLRIDGSSVIKAILREPRFPDNVDVIIYLDFVIAFDKVDHGILLNSINY